MSSLRPPGSVVVRHIDEGIDPDLVDVLVSFATGHLGSAVQVLHRIGWGEQTDSENWSIITLVVTGSYAAVVEYRATSRDQGGFSASKHIVVFPLSEVRSFSQPAAGLPSLRLASSAEPVYLPKGSKASEFFSVR